MPPKFRYTREEMIAAALELVRQGGKDALTARALGAKLGCSAKPIFGLFRNMEELDSASMGYVPSFSAYPGTGTALSCPMASAASRPSDAP